MAKAKTERKFTNEKLCPSGGTVTETVGSRVRAIREERGEKQPEFAAALSAAAKRLRMPLAYDNTMVSKMETGMRAVTIEDIAVIASLDPQGRQKSWLAWGEIAESAANPRPHSGAPDLELTAPQRPVLPRRRRGEGGR